MRTKHPHSDKFLRLLQLARFQMLNAQIEETELIVNNIVRATTVHHIITHADLSKEKYEQLMVELDRLYQFIKEDPKVITYVRCAFGTTVDAFMNMDKLRHTTLK